jgi:hypothetical protein
MNTKTKEYSQPYSNMRSIIDILTKNDPITIKIARPRNDSDLDYFMRISDKIDPSLHKNYV